MNIKTAAAHLMSFVIVALAVMMAWIIYLAWFGYRDPVEIRYSHPVPVAFPTRDRAALVDKPVIPAGDTLYSFRDYCNLQNYRILRVERWLIREDGDRTKDVALPLLPSRAIKGKGHCEARTFDIQIPEYTQPGKYFFVSTWDFTIDWNPIATYHWSWPDVVTIVVEAQYAKGERGPRGEKGEQGERGKKGTCC